VRQEAERGATVVVVTHDDAFAKALNADVVALERGRRVTSDD
jgi:ABC-type polar amino acid transport system ATPase subunit